MLPQKFFVMVHCKTLHLKDFEFLCEEMPPNTPDYFLDLHHIIGSKIKSIVNLSVTYQNLSGEK